MLALNKAARMLSRPGLAFQKLQPTCCFVVDVKRHSTYEKFTFVSKAQHRPLRSIFRCVSVAFLALSMLVMEDLVFTVNEIFHCQCQKVVPNLSQGGGSAKSTMEAESILFS